MLSNFPLSPPSASNFAAEHDRLFYAITVLTILFTAMVAGMVLFFAAKYRRGTTADRSRPVYENARFEFVSMVIPTILGLGIFVWATHLFVKMRTPPDNASEIFVIGKQWMWHVQHPDGTRENNTLHVAVGKPVKLTMISQDVIHAFYVPAFRVQYMVVPGRFTQIWFTPTEPGSYHLFCNMYCGTQHSEMGGRVVVMKPAEYAEWLARNGEIGPKLSVAQSGERLFNKVGCANCHGAESTPRGPSLVGIFNTPRKQSDGMMMRADETYLREAILRPENHLVAGYENMMPRYEGQLTEDQVVQLIAYMKGGTAGGALSSTGVYSPNVPGLESNVNGKPINATNALNSRAERGDSTPTIRNSQAGSASGPAVNALAAREAANNMEPNR